MFSMQYACLLTINSINFFALLRVDFVIGKSGVNSPEVTLANFYVFNECVNKRVQNYHSSREGTIFPDVLGHPLLTVSNTDP